MNVFRNSIILCKLNLMLWKKFIVEVKNNRSKKNSKCIPMEKLVLCVTKVKVPSKQNGIC